jgi:uncharacterized protein (TIGR03067 family)
MYASMLTGLALLVAAPGPKDAPKKEPTIVGEWVGEKAVAGGMDLPIPQGGIIFNFTADGKLNVREPGSGKAEEGGSFKIDSKKAPPEIDLIPPEGRDQPTMLGIYKIDGDTLTLCLQMGSERPTKFESPAGTMTMVMTFHRVKKE